MKTDCRMRQVKTRARCTSSKSQNLFYTCAHFEILREGEGILEYRALMVAGDGNCLYRSVSLLLYGTDSYHELLRLTTAVEILSNQQWYDTTHPNCRCPFNDERRLFLPDYQQLCADTATDGTYSDMLTMYALSRTSSRRRLAADI